MPKEKGMDGYQRIENRGCVTENNLLFPAPRFALVLNFLEFRLERVGLSNPLEGDPQSQLLGKARAHLLVHIIAQMAFQLVQRHGSFDASSEHLPPPFRDFFI